MRSTPDSNSDSKRDWAIHSWISKQLTGLAEAFGEQLTLERVEIYVSALADIPQDRLQIAFRKALYELKFFPRLAELREFAGSGAEEERKVEAQAAWEYANQYLRKWGVRQLPIRSEGKWITAPPLDPRLEYALRQIGGLWRLNQVTDETYHFIFRDFCEAYMLAPVADLMATQLLEKFSVRELAGQIKELPQPGVQQEVANSQEPGNSVGLSQEGPHQEAEDLTSERREELRQKLAKEMAARGIPRRAGGLE